MKSLRFLVCSGLALAVGCSEGDSFDQRTQAALSTEGVRVFGFELPSDWTSSSGVTLGQSAQHTQGSFAMAVNSSGWVHVRRSANFGTLEQLDGRVSLDLYLNEPVSWGGVRLIMESPSGGRWYYEVPCAPSVPACSGSEIGLAGVTAGQWAHLEFQIPESVRSSFENKTDVDLRIIVNAPQGTRLLDNLEFGTLTSGGTGGSGSGGSGTGGGATGGSSTGGSGGAEPSDRNAEILGFESLVGISTSASLNDHVTLSTETGGHYEGAASFAVAVPTGGTHELTLAPLTTLADVGDTIGLFVRLPSLPNQAITGAIQLFASAPSRGLYNQWIGQVPLDGTLLHQGAFKRVQLRLPANVTTALTGATYSDLRFKIVFSSVPAGTYLLDRMSLIDEVPAVAPAAPSSAADAILSFTDLSGWSASAGQIDPGDQLRGETLGDGSYCVSGATTTELVSNRMSTLGELTNDDDEGAEDNLLELDLSLADGAQPVTAQLFFSIPSANIYNQWIGQVTSSIGSGQVEQPSLRFELSEAHETLIETGVYGDLQFKLVVQNPSSAKVCFDRLGVGQQPFVPEVLARPRVRDLLVVLPPGVEWSDVASVTGVGDPLRPTEETHLIGYGNGHLTTGFSAPPGARTLLPWRIEAAEPAAEWPKVVVGGPTTVAPIIPSTATSPFVVNASTPLSSLTALSGAFVRFEAGDYQIGSLTFRSGSTVQLQNEGSPIRVFSAGGGSTMLGQMVPAVTNRNNVFWLHPGRPGFIHPANDHLVTLGGETFGTIVAPRVGFSFVFGAERSHRGQIIALAESRILPVLDFFASYEALAIDTQAACAAGCAATVGCLDVDADQDGLGDCFENSDLRSSTHATTFNGLTFSAKPSEASLVCEGDSFAVIDASLAISPGQTATGTTISGWTRIDARLSDAFCNGRLLPGGAVCEPDPGLFDFRGAVRIDAGGRHCFRLADRSKSCAAGSVGSAMLEIGDVTCLDLDAGHQPIRLAFSTAIGPEGTAKGTYLTYCYGGQADCVPQVPLPSGMLFVDTESSEAVPCDDNPLTCTELCPCDVGANPCDDGNACTTDICNYPEPGVHHYLPIEDDGDPCTVCDPDAGVVPVAVEDDNACTLDSCDPSTGTVIHEYPVSQEGPCVESVSCGPDGQLQVVWKDAGTACGSGFECDGSYNCVRPGSVKPDTPFQTTADIAAQIPRTAIAGCSLEQLDPERAAIVVGRVSRELMPAGILDAFAGVKVTAVGACFVGSTLTGADGEYRLAVNGGRPYRLRFEHADYLTAERTVHVGWDTTAAVDEVVLVLGSSTWRGIEMDGNAVATSALVNFDLVEDDPEFEGDERQAGLYLPAGRVIEAFDADGNPIQFGGAFGQLQVAVTEYTTGPNGLQRMPAGLPPGTDYTYAMEIQAGSLTQTADEVRFSAPVYYWVENHWKQRAGDLQAFVDDRFEIGSDLASWYYNRATGAWEPETDANKEHKVDARSLQVIETEEPGEYAVNFDSLPGPDSLVENPLGLTQEEVNAIGRDPDRGPGVYLRLPLSRFSPHDINPPGVCFGGACADAEPAVAMALGCGSLSGKPSVKQGSIIEVEQQVLREHVALPGTQYRLSYNSSRQPGYVIGRSLSSRTRFSFPPLPDHWDWKYERRTDRYGVAGRLVKDVWCTGTGGGVPCTESRADSDIVLWDGLDFNGYPAYGTFTVADSMVHVPTFHHDCEGGCRIGNKIVFVLPYPIPVPQQKTFQLTLGDDRFLGLGGWSLEPQHWYSPSSRAIFRGDGSISRGDTAVVERVATPEQRPSPFLDDIVVLPDREVLYTVYFNGLRRVHAVGSSKHLIQVAGDSGHVRLAYDSNTERLLVFSRLSGTLTAYKRVGPLEFTPEMVNGSQRSFALPANTGEADDVAVAPDGTIVLLIRHEREDRELLRLSSDFVPMAAPREFVPLDSQGQSLNANQQKVCNEGETCFRFGRTGLYRSEGNSSDWHTGHLAIQDDGTIWVACSDRVLKYSSERGYERMIGPGDGHPENAISKQSDPLKVTTGQIRSLMADSKGLVVATSTDMQLYRYGANTDGLPGLTLLAGAYGSNASNSELQVVAAMGAVFDDQTTFGMGPDGSIYSLENRGNGSIRRYSARMAIQRASVEGEADDGYLVPDAGGRETYLFDSEGFHRETRSVATGEVVTSFEYENGHHLKRIWDRGLVTELVHSDSEVEIRAPGGQVTKLTKGPTGHLTRIDEEDSGDSTFLSHDEGGMLGLLIDSRQVAHQFEYDSFGRLIRDHTAGQATQELERDAQTREVRHISAEGEVTRYSVGTDRSQSSVSRVAKEPDGSTWSLSTASAAGGLEQRRQEFSDGSVLVETFDRNPEIETYVREPRETTWTFPGGGVFTTMRATTIEDHLRTETVSVRNGFTDELVATQVRNRQENTLTTTSPRGRKVTVTYDGLERATAVQSGSLLPLEMAYCEPMSDCDGRVESTSRGSRNTSFYYFPVGHPTGAGGYLKQVQGPSRDVTFTRNEHGQVLTATFEQGNAAAPGPTLEYDQLGNLTRVVQPDSAQHEQLFSALNLLSSYEAPVLESGTIGYQTRFEHDRDRRLEEVIHPDGLSVEYVRSEQTDTQKARARTILGTDPWGEGSFATTLSYADDLCGGATACAAPCILIEETEETPEVCYDPRGRAEQLVEMNRNGVSTEFFWNGPVQVGERTSGPIGGTTVHVQGGFDHRIQRTGRTLVGSNGDNPWTFTTGYEYDADGILTHATVLDDENEVLSQVEYQFDCFVGDSLPCGGHGLLESTLAGAVTQTFGHNDYGELARMTATATVSGTPVTLVDLVLDDGDDAQRDGEGRITTRTETRGSDARITEFDYDPRGQLKLVTEERSVGGVTEEVVRRYNYDANGNRLCTRNGPLASTCPDVGEPGRATYDAQDRLVVGEDGTQYSYQERGTLLQSISGVGPDRITRTYGYDPMGNLLRVEIDRETGSDTSIEYQVDALGRRVGRMHGTTLRQYVWDGQLRIAATVVNGTVESEFVYTHHPSTPDLVRRGSDVYRIVSDERGTPLLGVDVANGDVWFEAEWDEWGNLTSLKRDGSDEQATAASYPIPQGFAGGLFDPITGLTRFGVRDYDPKVGRWTSKDPILFQGGQGNLYVYVGNDPVGFVDPEGRWSVGGEIYAGIGGGLGFGHEGGRWFLNYEFGFGLGVGAQLDLLGGFPVRDEGWPTSYDGLGTGASLHVGPVSLEWVVGGAHAFDELPDGSKRPREPVSFFEPTFSLTKWGLGAGAKSGLRGGWAQSSIECR